MTINEERVRKGIAALRSGEFKKTKGRMKKGDCFCALGVFTEVYRRETGQGEWMRRPTGDGIFKIGTERSSTDLPYTVMAWYGFDKPDPCILGRFTDSIGNMNDVQNLSFDEIADRLEAFFFPSRV